MGLAGGRCRPGPSHGGARRRRGGAAAHRLAALDATARRMDPRSCRCGELDVVVHTGGLASSRPEGRPPVVADGLPGRAAPRSTALSERVGGGARGGSRTRPPSCGAAPTTRPRSPRTSRRGRRRPVYAVGARAVALVSSGSWSRRGARGVRSHRGDLPRYRSRRRARAG